MITFKALPWLRLLRSRPTLSPETLGALAIIALASGYNIVFGRVSMVAHAPWSVSTWGFALGTFVLLVVLQYIPRMAANQKLNSGVTFDVLGNAHGMRGYWVWAAPAMVSLAILGLVVAWHGGGIASTARWPEQQIAFRALNLAVAAWPDALWAAITLFGDASVLMPILALFLLRRPQVWAAVLASVPFSALSSTLVKHWADVPRPATVLDQGSFNLVGTALHFNSFPSGHSLTAFAAAAAVIATLAPAPQRGRDWMLVIAGLLLATTVALSRIAVGAHWPLDLVSGASFGWLAGLGGAALSRRAGWWRWLFLGSGKRAVSMGFIMWGVALWLRPGDTLACAGVLGLAGLCGIRVGIGLLLTGQSVSNAVPLAPLGPIVPDVSGDQE